MTLRRLTCIAVLGLSALAAPPDICAQSRLLQPRDLFDLERIGRIEWSPDRSAVALEIHQPSRWLDRNIPTAKIVVLDVASGTLRTISPSQRDIIGFFSPAWSPDSRRLVFLSVDNDARVRVWLWSGSGSPTFLTDLTLHDGLLDPPVATWHDENHVVFMARDSTHSTDGLLYFGIHRGRNAADMWARVHSGTDAVVSVLDSRGPSVESSQNSPNDSQRRIVLVNVETQTIRTIATGDLHRPSLSPDRRTLTYWRENPPFSKARVATFFGPGAQGDAAYDAVNWGSEVHHIDLTTGAATGAPQKPRSPAPSSSSEPLLRLTNTMTEGTRLLLSRPKRADTVVWQGNAWVAEIQTGRTEAISYKSTNGASLTGWILYPPGYTQGRRIPIVTVVYPGTMYSDRIPGAFSIFNPQFNHAQLFAALGYGVALPSMPAADKPMQHDALAELTAGVLPLMDTLIARGIGDADRFAVIGQSAGGWATLGLIAQTKRFRTAIASASYSNQASLYGTFYGQYRHGDAGNPQRAQVLRMLQFERGFLGADAPPWEQPERYRTNSPIWRAAEVETPLMLVHGENDFIPIQQAEEFFTALYRQDKRVRLVRYAGEEHTIAERANVIDLWRRLAAWLEETMPERRQ